LPPTPDVVGLFNAARSLDEGAFATLLAKVPGINEYLVSDETLLSALLRPQDPGPEIFPDGKPRYAERVAERRVRLIDQHRASMPRRVRMLALALKHGARPADLTRSARLPALHLATLFGTPEMVEMLLHAGADPKQLDGSYGLPAVECALRSSRYVQAPNLPDLVSRADRTKMLLALVKAGAKRPYLAEPVRGQDGQTAPVPGARADAQSPLLTAASMERLLWGQLVEMTEGSAVLDTFLRLGGRPPAPDSTENLLGRAAYSGNAAAVAWLKQRLPRYYDGKDTNGRAKQRDAWSEAAAFAIDTPFKRQRAPIFKLLVRADMDWRDEVRGEFVHYLPDLHSQQRQRSFGPSLLSHVVATGDSGLIAHAIAMGGVRNSPQKESSRGAAGYAAMVAGDPAADALIDALILRRPDLVRKLLAAGASPLAVSSTIASAISAKGTTALAAAANPQLLARRDAESASIPAGELRLLDECFDAMFKTLTPQKIRASDTAELTPLNDIVGTRHVTPEPVKLAKLVGAGFSLGKLSLDSLVEVLRNGDVKLARDMLDAGVGKNWSIMTPARTGETPDQRRKLVEAIGLAVDHGYLPVLDRLFTLRGTGSALGDAEHKLLGRLVFRGNVDGLKLLQARGVVIDATLNQPAVDSMQPEVIEFVLNTTGTLIGALCMTAYPDEWRPPLLNAMMHLDEGRWQKLLALGVASLAACPGQESDAKTPMPLAALAKNVLADPFAATGPRRALLPARVRQLRQQGMASADYTDAGLRSAVLRARSEPALQDLLSALEAPAQGVMPSTTPTDPTRAHPMSLVGSYQKEGGREAAIGLQLKADGRFKWAASYGATDKYAEGSWHVSGDKVVFSSDTPAPFTWFKVQSQTQYADGPDLGQVITVRVDIGRIRLLDDIRLALQIDADKLSFLRIAGNRDFEVIPDGKPTMAALWFPQMGTVLAAEVALPDLPRLKSLTLALQLPDKAPATAFNETMTFDSTGLYSADQRYERQK
jgi:hypothetical protein